MKKCYEETNSLNFKPTSGDRIDEMILRLPWIRYCDLEQ